MKNNKDQHSDFLDQVWKTKGARFNAYRRFKRTQEISNLFIAFSSAGVIIVSLISLIPSTFGFSVNVVHMSLISLVFSIFILLVSVLENGKQYQIKSERLFINANEITKIYDRLNDHLKTSPGKVKIDSLMREYHLVLEKCQENHEPVDYQIFEMEHPHLFKYGFIKGICVWVDYFKKVFGFYILLIFLFGILIFLMK